MRREARAQVLEVLPEGIPHELKALPQWVNWAGIWNENKEKFSKPPMTAGGRNASSTAPHTWTTLDKSLAALGHDGMYIDNAGEERRVTLDGVGIAGLGRTPYTGIDLDHCVDPQTGEITPAALKIVEAFDSYTERSPSGEGIRIFIEAEKPPTWSANKGGETDIEVYNKGRFLTVTGQRLKSAPRTIERRQEVLDAFMEHHAPERPQTARIEGYLYREPYTGSGDYVFPLEEFLEEFGVDVLKGARDSTSERTYYIVCPWAHEHTGGDTSGTKVGQFPSGAPWFKCYHGHCDGRRWGEFREKVEPGGGRTYARRRGEISIVGPVGPISRTSTPRSNLRASEGGAYYA